MNFKKIGLVAFALFASVFTLNACDEISEPTLKPNTTTSIVVDTTTSTNPFTSTGVPTTSAPSVLPETAGSITGKLVCGDTAITGVSIELRDSNDTKITSVTVDTNGTFLFDKVDNRTYSLKFTFDKDGYSLTEASRAVISEIVVSNNQAVDLGNINFTSGPVYGPLH